MTVILIIPVLNAVIHKQDLLKESAALLRGNLSSFIGSNSAQKYESKETVPGDVNVGDGSDSQEMTYLLVHEVQVDGEATNLPPRISFVHVCVRAHTHVSKIT